MATYGIDLGTTHSCIAYVDETGRPVVLKSAVGEDTTPSVVYFESPDNVVVGRQAKDSAVLAPHLVVELVKRQMGEDIHYSFHGQDHTPESISALILRELAHAAEQQTGEEVRDVVITVPAYFGLLEREATRKAGQIAGLNVLDVLAEPVAAALNYQVARGRDSPRCGTSSSTTSAAGPSTPPSSASTAMTSRSSVPTATTTWAEPTGTARSSTSCCAASPSSTRSSIRAATSSSCRTSRPRPSS